MFPKIDSINNFFEKVTRKKFTQLMRDYRMKFIISYSN